METWLPCNSSSNHWDCVHLSNFRTILNQEHDKFNFIYLQNQKQVVYSNGEIYKTNCSKIQGFEIMEKIDRCTSDSSLYECDFSFFNINQFLHSNSTGLKYRGIYEIHFFSKLFLKILNPQSLFYETNCSHFYKNGNKTFGKNISVFFTIDSKILTIYFYVDIFRYFDMMLFSFFMLIFFVFLLSKFKSYISIFFILKKKQITNLEFDYWIW